MKNQNIGASQEAHGAQRGAVRDHGLDGRVPHVHTAREIYFLQRGAKAQECRDSRAGIRRRTHERPPLDRGWALPAQGTKNQAFAEEAIDRIVRT